MELAAAKSWWIMKKRKHGLPAEILPEEVVTVSRRAIYRSFMVPRYSRATLVYLALWTEGLDPRYVTKSFDATKPGMHILLQSLQTRRLRSVSFVLM